MFSLPPPLDHHPDFPIVYFSRAGHPVLSPSPTASGTTTVNTVCRIVPSPSNPYVHHFGEGNPRDWDPPDVVKDTVEDWHELGLEVTFHTRNPDVHAIGTTRGRSHFLCGGGISLFVLRELGPLPDNKTTCGVTTSNMIAILAITVPNPTGRPAGYHVVPAEYMEDTPLPGIPRGLTPAQTERWIPPPPTFHCGYQVPDSPNLFFAQIQNEISKEEKARGGNTFLDLTMRGPAYFSANGFPQPPPPRPPALGYRRLYRRA